MSTRDEYVRKMKEQLDEWNDEIGKLEARIRGLTGPVKENLEAQLDKAQDSYESAKQKLEELRGAGESSWERLRGEAEHAWGALKHSVNYFKSQF
jgi:chromosome segregation ATPase